MIFQNAELRKLIKYSKNCEENEENLAIFTVILMAAFGTKNVHSALVTSAVVGEQILWLTKVTKIMFLNTYTKYCNKYE